MDYFQNYAKNYTVLNQLWKFIRILNKSEFKQLKDPVSNQNNLILYKEP